MRIEFKAGKDERRLARQVVRKLPTGVQIGEPARLEDAQGNFVGWAIAHPDLTEIDAIRLKYVMDSMAAGDSTFTDPDLDDDGKVGAGEIKALKDRIDAVPAVDAAIKAHRKALRDAQPK